MNEQPVSHGKSTKAEENPTVRLDAEATHLLVAAARKAGVSKAQYTSACIKHFAKTGLNPMKEQPKGLANVDEKVSQETRAIRVQNVDIGNRLIGIIRAWEKTLYSYMQLQQGSTLSYLEKIEKNILAHQVSVETHFLAPMVEQIMKANIEAYMARVVSEWSYLEIKKKPEDFTAQDERLSNERDKKLLAVMREFLTAHTVPTPQLSVKPAVPAAPSKAIADPTTNAFPSAVATPPTPTLPK
ncbi:MAG: hypothetical protein ACRYG7_54680 [Janthinobacterium lividum]